MAASVLNSAAGGSDRACTLFATFDPIAATCWPLGRSSGQLAERRTSCLRTLDRETRERFERGLSGDSGAHDTPGRASPPDRFTAPDE